MWSGHRRIPLSTGPAGRRQFKKPTSERWFPVVTGEPYDWVGRQFERYQLRLNAAEESELRQEARRAGCLQSCLVS